MKVELEFEPVTDKYLTLRENLVEAKRDEDGMEMRLGLNIPPTGYIVTINDERFEISMNAFVGAIYDAYDRENENAEN